MLVSETTMTVLALDEAFKIISSSLWRWAALLSLFL